MNDTKHKRILSIEDEVLHFQYLENEELKDEILLKTGFRYLAETFFRNDIPTEAETEYSYNFV